MIGIDAREPINLRGRFEDHKIGKRDIAPDVTTDPLEIKRKWL